MIHGLKPYPKYKDSGVPWLGKVPEHWGVRRLRNIVEMRVSSVDKHSKEGEAPARLCNYVDVYKHERIRASMEFMKATASAEEIERFRLERGDVLITKDSEAWDDIGVPALVESSAPDLISGYHLAGGAFLLRVLQSRPVGYQFHVEAKGVTRYGLSHHGIKSVSVPFPPLHEQTAIVRFLDWADRRIRRVIRLRNQRIKLLEEYKQALINRAVTGKIDVRTGKPYPKYKHSGVEWLGEVPEHWEVRRLKSIARLRSGEAITSERIEESGDYAVYGGNGIRGFTASFTHEGEFVLIGRQGALCGNINYARGRFWASEHAVVAQPIQKLALHWFGELLRTMNLNQYSIAAAQPGLAVERIQNLAITLPPIEEQEHIEEHIKKRVTAFDAAIAADRRVIDLLKEFRTRLVADVVTGKLDVREAAAKLPDERPEDEAETLEDVETDEGDEMADEAGLEALSEERFS